MMKIKQIYFITVLRKSLNNAIDHSGAAIVGIDVSETAIWLRISIVDYGIGIFKKI